MTFAKEIPGDAAANMCACFPGLIVRLWPVALNACQANLQKIEAPAS